MDKVWRVTYDREDDSDEPIAICSSYIQGLRAIVRIIFAEKHSGWTHSKPTGSKIWNHGVFIRHIDSGIGIHRRVYRVNKVVLNEYL